MAGLEGNQFSSLNMVMIVHCGVLPNSHRFLLNALMPLQIKEAAYMWTSKRGSVSSSYYCHALHNLCCH